MSSHTAISTAPATTIEEVDAQWHDLRYMSLSQARFLRDFFRKHQIKDVLELGFFQGKSTAFMAAMLEGMGAGHIVTMDLELAQQRTPSISTVLGSLGLSHRVTPVYAHRSFTWELCKLLEQQPRPQFDFCYIDGAHTWDGTGFSFLLVDLLLRPGGWVIFDDMNWSISKSAAAASSPRLYEAYDDEEKQAMQVRKVWELLVPARGYSNLHENPERRWGLAQKAGKREH